MIDDVAGVTECNENSVILNSIVNAKIESKKLQFNLTKCVNMHIGPNKEKCQSLKVHESQMLTTDKQKYLGDVISSSGYNNVNIKERCKIGHQAISQIKSNLSDVNYGRYMLQTGLLMRDSIFVSKMLLNSEVWHSVTKSQLEELEIVDKILLRHLLNAHSKTGLEWIFADTGKLNLRSLLQIRRLMYLWHLLSREESEMISRVYNTQKVSHSVGDWVRLVEGDKTELGITLTDRDIQGVSKNVFNNFVKKKVRSNMLKQLAELKKKHSKAKYLDCSELKPAKYIQDSRFNTSEKHLLFKLRSKTLDVKENFKGQNKSPWCTTCGLFPETQNHLLQCPELVIHLKYMNVNFSTLNEIFIYGNIHQQQMIVKIYSDIIEIRVKLQPELSNDET